MSHEYEVNVGSEEVAIQRKGSSEIVIAKILGRDCDDEGKVVAIWLDRRVHTASDVQMGKWNADGAVVTVLTLSSEQMAA